MSIKIMSSEHPATILWQASLRTEEEYHNLKEMCMSGSMPYWQCLLMPARTDTLDNFAKDFFFPILYHQAIRVDALAQNAIQKLVYFLVDLLTFPIRVITCIPRAIYNEQKPEHALLTYLKGRNIDRQLIEAGHVRVELEFLFGQNSTFVADCLGRDRSVAREKGELTVHFCTLPEMISDNGIWTRNFREDHNFSSMS